MPAWNLSLIRIRSSVTKVAFTLRVALRRQITDPDRAGLRKDLIHAPAWIVDLLRPLLDDASLKS